MNLAARAVLLIAIASLFACQRKEVPIVNPDYFVLLAEDSKDKEKLLDLRDINLRGELVESPTPGEWGIMVAVKQPAAGRLEQWSAANINKHVGVYVDGRLVSSPTVTGAFGDSFMLQGGFTKDEAEAILEGMRRGGAPKS